MRIIKTKQFEKDLAKIPLKIRGIFVEKFELFLHNEFDKILHNHKLHPPYVDCRSINITGDYRLIYKKVDTDAVLLYRISTHSQLYE